MGVLAPGSAHARPTTRRPIDMSEKNSLHVFAKSPSNISPTALNSHIRSFGTLGQLLKIPPIFPPKYSIVQGVGGVPDLFEDVESSYFCYLGPHVKFRNL